MTASAAPTKVVRVIARLNTGGPAIHTILLTRGLNGSRFSSVLVTGRVTGAEGDMRYYAARMNVEPVVLPDLGRPIAPLKDVRALHQLYRVMRNVQPDIIHTHTAKAGLLGRLAGLLYNAGARWTGRRPARLVHTFHGHVFDGYFGSVRSTLLVVAERALARVSHQIIAISESVKRDLVERYRICPHDKVAVVPLGFDFEWVGSLSERAGLIRGRPGVPREAVIIGIVGRLTEIKNHRLLFASVARLNRDDVRLVVFGDGELRADLERAVDDLGLKGVIIFVGWQADPGKIYADLDIVCLTSRNEGTPVALIESMAASKAVISTDVGGVDDLMVGAPAPHPDGFDIYRNGILVRSEDEAGLAAALRYLCDRPGLRQAMGSAGRASVERRFSERRLVADMEAIYTRLLGQGPS